MAPGDEVPLENESAGENVCPACGGSGRIEGGTCRDCGGRGTITEAVGGG